MTQIGNVLEIIQEVVKPGNLGDPFEQELYYDRRKLLEDILRRSDSPSMDILEKANDGRGIGHISRVLNYVSHPLLQKRVVLIVNEEYAKRAQARGLKILSVPDYGFRIDLEDVLAGSGKPRRYEKFIPKEMGVCTDIDHAIKEYYKTMYLAITEGTKLVYIDDQNCPETIFSPELGKALGEDWQEIKKIAEKASIAVEMETQDIYSESMWRAFEKARYIHLSTSIEFLKRATLGRFNMRGLEDKLVETKIILSKENKAELTVTGQDKEKEKQKLFNDYTEGKCTKFVQVSFGGGEGAQNMVEILYELAKKNPDTLFSISDPKGSLWKGFQEKHGALAVEKSKDEKGNPIYHYKCASDLNNLYVGANAGNHLHTSAVADILIQGNGSNTTYEGMYTANPIINIPLERPGHEQDYKAAGVKNIGGGEIFLLKERDNEETRDFYRKCGITDLNVLDSENLSACLKRMIENKKQYSDKLMEARRELYGSETMVALSVYLMAEHVEPGQIRYILGLDKK